MTTPTTTPNDYSNVPLEIIRQITVTSTSNDTIDGRFGPERSFTATVPWTTFAYNVKYPVALGIDPKQNQQVWCRFKRENLRKNRDGQFHPGTNDYHFWWGLTAYNIEAPEPGQENVMGSTPKDQTTNGTTTYSTAQVFGNTATVNSDSIEVRGDIQGHLEKLSVDLYVGVMGISLSDNLDQINYQHIRMIRDRLYHNVKDELIRPLYYCYEHEAVREFADEGYSHKLDEHTYCVYHDSIEQPFFLQMDTPTVLAEQPVVEQAPAEQPVVEQAVQATLEPATDGLPGGSARE